MAEKTHMNLITIGHVDQGKSTLIGRLLWDTKNIPEQEMKKIEERAKELKKDTFKFAFLLDTIKEERERGVTIDVMHRRFDTPKYYFTIIDCPGHRDFVKNMITGASQADAAILVIGTKDGVMPQTKEHIFLIKTLGVKQLIVAMNKMDEVEFSEEKYNKIKADVEVLLKSVGINPAEIPFIPLSAWTGDNITTVSDKMPWYKGKSFLEILNDLEAPDMPTNKPLRFPVQDVYTITGVGTVPVGRIESGTIKANDKLVFMPSGKTGDVKSVEMHHELLSSAKAGDNVGINVRGIGKNDISRGEVAGHPDNPPTVAKEFTARIIVLQHPNVITKGYTPVFHVHTAHTACKIVEIVEKINPSTGETVAKNPDYIKAGDAAIIRCVPTKPMVIEKQSEFPQLAKFAMRDMGMTIAAGMCMDVVPEDK
ncbi:MAG: translation elongation factor EF-1 subunit alpha [Candidatus Nanohalarchaeota archaeon]|nr:MAG: translation elongation factor EF-1 subunit alpha [Candidatus Nanohaloarchaeota archaeon]